VLGIPLDTAIDQYAQGRSPSISVLSPNEVLLPEGRIIDIQLDESGTSGDFSIFRGVVEAIQTYLFDPTRADLYLFAVAGDTFIASVVIPEQGLTDHDYVLEIDEQSFSMRVGEVFDFRQHGFPTGVSGFAIRNLDIPVTHELVTGLTFTGSGSIFFGEVSLRLTSNQPPVAKAGLDQSVNEGDFVTLDGSGSSDPNGDSLQWIWSQVAGATVTLNLSDPVHPTFMAPSVPVAGSTLSFQLVVSDGQLSSTPTTVNITVKNVNHAWVMQG
jgi:hypothetical protein